MEKVFREYFKAVETQDIIYYEPTRPASFPDNGGTLTDAVQDIFLAIVTNGKVKTDRVGPHHDSLAVFRYVGQPHMACSAKLAATPSPLKQLASCQVEGSS